MVIYGLVCFVGFWVAEFQSSRPEGLGSSGFSVLRGFCMGSIDFLHQILQGCQVMMV